MNCPDSRLDSVQSTIIIADQFKRFGVEVIEAGRWDEALKLEISTPVYISMDIDALDPSWPTRRFPQRTWWALYPTGDRFDPQN